MQVLPTLKAIGRTLASVALTASMLALSPSQVQASIAYGSINNFDTVNDTGHECHGFEIELDDCHSTNISYTYNYNHYGVPEITEDHTDPAHPKVFIKWQSKKNPDGSWAAYTAIPAGPISPTNGHMFTNPAINFGGEHFGVGYNAQPTAVLYNWLIDNGSGTLIHGGAVQVSTPTFTYYPPVAAAPAQVQAVIVPPPPPVPPPLEFGKAVWVKEIKTTTHNANKVKLRELVSDDPDNQNDKNWKNGEPDEVEVEWRILQKKKSAPDGGVNNNVAALPEELPNGNEVVTRRYEFFKYVGPLDAETGEAMGDLVGPDGLHGSGTVTYADHFDAAMGEWVTVTTNLSTVEVVGDFTGSQMAAVDVNEPVGLIDHVGDGKVGQAFADRAVVVKGAQLFDCTHSGTIPPGMTFTDATGILSGTPTTAGQYSFSVTATDTVNPDVQKNYTMNIAAVGAALAPASLLDTAASPVGAGTTTGDGSFAVGANATATATAAAGYTFLNWTDNGQIVSTNTSYTLAMDVNHSLVANFVPTYSVTTSSLPVAGGTTTGDGSYNEGDSVTVVATPNAGYTFANWTDGGVPVCNTASFTFTALADTTLVANFTLSASYTVTTSAVPLAGGTTGGDGSFASGSNVTVTATPNAGYAFVNWTLGGTQVSTNTSYTFAITANKALVANFAPIVNYTVSTSAAPLAGGTTSGGGSFAGGTSTTVTATANAGYFFVNWTSSGTQVSTNASYTFAVNANRTLVANFSVIGGVLRTISTSANPVSGGILSGAGTYADGASATVIATANPGYEFNKWKEGSSNVSNNASYTFTVAANRNLTATFNQVFVVNTSSSPTAGGTAEMDSSSYKSGEKATALAKPNANYTFVNWTENGNVVSSLASYNFTITGNRTLVANFNSTTGVTVTTSSLPLAGGTTTGSGAYTTGDSVTVSAIPNAGYAFDNWTLNGTVVSTSADYTFTASANTALVAHFNTAIAITTAASPPAGGTTTGDGDYASGASATVSAAANPGYIFVNWTDNGTAVSTLPDYTFTVTAPRTLTANFVAGWAITIAAAPVSGGSVTGGGNVADGTTVNLSATPAAGYQFAKWTEGGTEVSTSASYSFTASADRDLVANFTLVSGGVKFDFDATATPVALGAPVPFDQMAASIIATFGAPTADAFTVGNATTTGYTLGDFSGQYLVPGVNGQVLTIQFNQSVTAVTARFALKEALNLAAHSTVKLTAIDNTTGMPVEVGSTTTQGAVKPGDSLAGGLLSLNGGVNFDFVRIEIITAAQPDAGLLCDNISVSPTSTGGYLTLANPNWNITLTDAGYSDFLLDNTPGFVGREYLSGEWGAAVGYKVGNSTKGPKWMERNWVYPDWTTNSDFNVVMPITLMSSNADGLPIAQSIIANSDIEITIRYEMIDTVTGMAMGVAANSAGGAGSSIPSNRYILNQSYTVKNISGATISNLQVFQFLHGLTSEHGVQDNRTYAGKHSDYHFDSTLAGVDASTIGSGGSSSSGLEDYIGFSSKIAPSAFEIGHYGIDPIDNHGTGKPSDGVHLSIEDNWSSAPYSTRQGTDYFAPANRWVAGGQRLELGTLADGQSASVDVMLSILTGTTVTITPGGGGGAGNHSGSGSCNGGSSHVGGVDFVIDQIDAEGTFFGQESEADDDEIAERIADGEFVLPNFAEPGGLSQVWNLQFNGSHTGHIHLTFAYDPALLPAGFNQEQLTIYHFHAGAWEQLVGTVNPVNHTITVTTDSLSPFMLGIPTANAIPKMAVAAPSANTQQLNWTTDTTGWTLEESTDLINWVPSARAVNTVGNTSTVTVTGAGSTRFFRLSHP